MTGSTAGQFRSRLPIPGNSDGFQEGRSVAGDHREPLTRAGGGNVKQILRHAVGGDYFVVDRLALAAMRCDGVAVGKLAIRRRQLATIFQLNGAWLYRRYSDQFAVRSLEGVLALFFPVGLQEQLVAGRNFDLLLFKDAESLGHVARLDLDFLAIGARVP